MLTRISSHRLTTLSFLALGWIVVIANGLSTLDKPRSGFLQDVLQSRSVDQKYCKPSGLIDDACCDFETVESVNEDLFNSLHQIVAQPYFRYHKVDLYRECPFWQEDGSCMNRACGVETTEQQDIPEQWRPSKLGKLERMNTSLSESPEGKNLIKDSDFCVLEDELDSEGVYVDLLENPERFTGYAGPSSSRVWKAIYEENCFTPVTFIDPSRGTDQGGQGFAPLSRNGFSSLTRPAPNGRHGLGKPSGFENRGREVDAGWGENEKKLFGNLAGPRDGGDETCLEKRVFYRVISGLHASISIHICDDYLDKTTGEWSPNLQCFVTRIAQHPERLQNVYFTYVLLLRALSKSGPLLLRTLQETNAEAETFDQLKRLTNVAGGCPTTFDEGSMFSGGEAELLKSEFKSHFRNVSLIMDCVGCDKCRLWGKLQITGLGTALKLLFSSESQSSQTVSSRPLNRAEGVKLSRSEIVAFINTLHRLSESLAAVERFRTLWNDRSVEQRKEVEDRAKEGIQEFVETEKKEEGEEVGKGMGRGKSSIRSEEGGSSMATGRKKGSNEPLQSSRGSKEAMKDGVVVGKNEINGDKRIKESSRTTKIEQDRNSTTPTPLIQVKEICQHVVDLCRGGLKNCVEFFSTSSWRGDDRRRSDSKTEL